MKPRYICLNTFYAFPIFLLDMSEQTPFLLSLFSVHYHIVHMFLCYFLVVVCTWLCLALAKAVFPVNSASGRSSPESQLAPHSAADDHGKADEYQGPADPYTPRSRRHQEVHRTYCHDPAFCHSQAQGLQGSPSLRALSTSSHTLTWVPRRLRPPPRTPQSPLGHPQANGHVQKL